MARFFINNNTKEIRDILENAGYIVSPGLKSEYCKTYGILCCYRCAISVPTYDFENVEDFLNKNKEVFYINDKDDLIEFLKNNF